MGVIDDIRKNTGAGADGKVQPVTPGPLSGGGVMEAVRQSVQPKGADGARQQAMPEPQRRTANEDWFKQLNADPRKSAGQLAREKKREKRDKIIAAVGDGISALSNLYFTTQYAPNMYTGRDTQSERTAARWQQLRDEYNNNVNAYIDGLRRARLADDDQWAKDRAWWLKLRGLDDAKAADKADRDFKAAENEKDRQAKKKLQDDEQEFKAAEGDKDRNNQRSIANIRANGRGNGSGGGKNTRGLGSDGYEFRVGKDEFVAIPPSRMNAVNLSQIIALLPPKAQEELRGKAYSVRKGNGRLTEYETHYEEPDADTYYSVIGRYMHLPEVANAVRELGGKPEVATDGTDWDQYKY